MKLNKSNQVEAISITVTKDKYPIVFENKVQELMEDCGMSREEAEKESLTYTIMIVMFLLELGQEMQSKFITELIL